MTVADGKIVGIGGPAQGLAVDARGAVLAPAMIVIHGEAFERRLIAWPGTVFPTEVALIDTDRQLAANSIATAYYVIASGWEPGLRAVSRGRGLRRLRRPDRARIDRCATPPDGSA